MSLLIATHTQNPFANWPFFSSRRRTKVNCTIGRSTATTSWWFLLFFLCVINRLWLPFFPSEAVVVVVVIVFEQLNGVQRYVVRQIFHMCINIWYGKIARPMVGCHSTRYSRLNNSFNRCLASKYFVFYRCYPFATIQNTISIHLTILDPPPFLHTSISIAHLFFAVFIQFLQFVLRSMIKPYKNVEYSPMRTSDIDR